LGCAEDVTGGVFGDAGVGLRSIGVASEGVQNSLLPPSGGRGQAEYRAATVAVVAGEVAALFGRSEQMALRVEDEAGGRRVTVSAFERVQHLETPSSVRPWGEFKHLAAAMSAAGGEIPALLRRAL
jgi:hypothetical protein